MIARGRPLGFLAAIALGWVGFRAAIMWPGAPVMAVPAARAADRVRPIALAAVPSSPRPALARSFLRAAQVGMQPVSGPTQLSDAQMIALFGLHYYVETRTSPTGADPDAALSPPTAPPADSVGAAVTSAERATPHWSMAGWLVARPGPADARLGPLLGASQAGARLSYALDEDRRVALFARAAKPLSRGGAELAAGVQWRPTRAPVTGFVEARYRQQAGIAPAAGVFGGIDVALPAAFRLETYGQAGWVGGRSSTGFAEGQARAARVVASRGAIKLDLGIGAWGATQRGASRLDIGPGVGVVVPIGRGAVRVGLDWRQRIAGRAAPGSGVALTLGAGF